MTRLCVGLMLGALLVGLPAYRWAARHPLRVEPSPFLAVDARARTTPPSTGLSPRSGSIPSPGPPRPTALLSRSAGTVRGSTCAA